MVVHYIRVTLIGVVVIPLNVKRKQISSKLAMNDGTLAEDNKHPLRVKADPNKGVDPGIIFFNDLCVCNLMQIQNKNFFLYLPNLNVVSQGDCWAMVEVFVPF